MKVEDSEIVVLRAPNKPVKMLSFEYTIPEFYNRAIECLKYLQSLGQFECNYSPGETLSFALDTWTDFENFKKLFLTLHTEGVVDGDIYVRFIDQSSIY
jgi:hypothetical protein